MCSDDTSGNQVFFNTQIRNSTNKDVSEQDELSQTYEFKRILNV